MCPSSCENRPQHRNPRRTKNSNRSKLLIPATKKIDSNSTKNPEKQPKSFELISRRIVKRRHGGHTMPIVCLEAQRETSPETTYRAGAYTSQTGNPALAPRMPSPSPRRRSARSQQGHRAMEVVFEPEREILAKWSKTPEMETVHLHFLTWTRCNTQ